MSGTNNSRNSKFPSRLIVVAGTYDGVLAGWDTTTISNATVEAKDGGEPDDFDERKLELQLLRRKGCDGKHLKLIFAMAAHEGSVRCLDIAGSGSTAVNSNDDPFPKTLLSGGYDETINVYNLYKRNQEGELKTPNDLGSPLCCSFAPPSSSPSPDPIVSTHALVGTTSGKIILYRNNKDWSIEHILSGHHPNEVSCLAVHPSGKLALSGGRSDGKLMLWDLMKGRLAYVHKVKVPSSLKRRKETTTINHIVWSGDGRRYAYCYNNKITVKDTSSGEDLLDVDMPGRVNQLAFIGGSEGMFVAAACDDGGLPVLEVGQSRGNDDENESNIRSDQNTRRAIMAIEPVEKVVAGDDRFKCIRCIEGGSGFLVVTANSGGVVSVMDLEGAIRMMITTQTEADESENSGMEDDDDASSENDDKEAVEVAVEILDSVRIGSGARITDLTVWSMEKNDARENDRSEVDDDGDTASSNDTNGEKYKPSTKLATKHTYKDDKTHIIKKRKGEAINKNAAEMTRNDHHINLDDEAVEKARKLVGQAKKHQKRKQKKKQFKTS